MLKLEQIAKIIQAKADNAYSLFKIYKELGETEESKKYRKEYSCLCEMLLLLEDEKHARKVADIYGVKI